MSKNIKCAIAAFLVLVTFFLTILSQSGTIVEAQTDVATVAIPSSVGGTTNPIPGTYTYANGTAFTLRATPDTGYVFQYWIVSGTLQVGSQVPSYSEFLTKPFRYPFPENANFTNFDISVLYSNPLTVTCGFGYTYQYTAVFSPVEGPSNASSADAGVVILQSTGGTVSPTPGIYTYANGTSLTLTATPAAGYVFRSWVVSGNYTPGYTQAQPNFYVDPENNLTQFFPTTTPISGIDGFIFTINPVTITWGYGYSYKFQAVFDLSPTINPSSTFSSTTSPTAQPTSSSPASSSTPVSTQSASPTVTSSPTGGGISVWVVAFVVVIIIIVVAALMMRRKK